MTQTFTCIFIKERKRSLSSGSTIENLSSLGSGPKMSVAFGKIQTDPRLVGTRLLSLSEPTLGVVTNMYNARVGVCYTVILSLYGLQSQLAYSSPRPYLIYVPFLKKALSYLQESLIRGEPTVDGSAATASEFRQARY